MKIFFDSQQKILALVGVVLVLIGSVAAWKCQGDIAFYCFPGLAFNFVLLGTDSNQFFMTAGILSVVAFLMLGTVARLKPWRLELTAIALTILLLYYTATHGLLRDNGGLACVLLSVTTTWCIVRANFIPRSRGVAITSALILTLLASYYFMNILPYRIDSDETGIVLLGAPQLLFAGALCILIASIWNQRRSVQPQAG